MADATLTAWTGAAATGTALALVAALQGFLDAAGLAAVVGAVAAGGWLGGFARPRVVQVSEPTPQERHSVAEALLANIPDPVILVDRRVVVIEANPAARALLPALRLRHPLSFALRAPEVLDGIEEVLRSGLPLTTTYVTRVPHERAFAVQVGALPMPDGPGGGQPNVVLFLRDLTEARRLESMRVDFVANASHELRTPLSALLGFIETLQGPARDDPRARDQFLGIMRVQAQRMARLIDALLSLSRIELHEHVAPTGVVDLRALTEQMVEMQAPLARERGAELAFHAPDAPCPVLGDRDELLRVVENLVENAVKYGGGTVAVSLRRDGPAEAPGRIALTVRDDGPGIAPEHIPRLTERFYRVEDASHRGQGGTGLGLAIVKHALNRHRGRLVIESTPGEGTVVTVELPEFHSVRGATGDSAPS